MGAGSTMHIEPSGTRQTLFVIGLCSETSVCGGSVSWSFDGVVVATDHTNPASRTIIGTGI